MENNPIQSSKTRLDFQAIRSQGQRCQPCSWMVCYWMPNNLKKGRIIWNISRKVAKAHVRNRLKRWCREFVRIHLGTIIKEQGLDLNFAFRQQSKQFYKDLRREEIDREFCRIEKKIKFNLREIN